VGREREPPTPTRGLRPVTHSAATASRPQRDLARRRYALVLLGAMAFAAFANFEASLCIPGMSMGGGDIQGGMAIAMEMPDGASPGFHCWAPMTAASDGVPLCPFSVGGVGPCGTAPPMPVKIAFSMRAFAESTVEFPAAESQVPGASPRVPTPPPRA
jgi:hypothetical protein